MFEYERNQELDLKNLDKNMGLFFLSLNKLIDKIQSTSGEHSKQEEKQEYSNTQEYQKIAEDIKRIREAIRDV